MTIQPEGRDVYSDVDLPKPERGVTEAQPRAVQELPEENQENVSALREDGDGADAGTGGLSGGDAQEDNGQASQDGDGLIAGDDATEDESADHEGQG